MSSEDDLQEPLIERLSPSPDPDSTRPSSKKRKRGSKEDVAKKPKNKKAKALEEDELDIEAGINRAFAHMDNQLLADYVAQRTRKYESDLSMIELEDKYIPGMAFNAL
jgi:protein CMS1